MEPLDHLAVPGAEPALSGPAGPALELRTGPGGRALGPRQVLRGLIVVGAWPGSVASGSNSTTFPMSSVVDMEMSDDQAAELVRSQAYEASDS